MIIKERLRGLGLVEGGRLRGGGVAERGGGDSQVSEDILNVALLVDVEILTPTHVPSIMEKESKLNVFPSYIYLKEHFVLNVSLSSISCQLYAITRLPL